MQYLQHPQHHHGASRTTRRIAGALVAVFGALLLAFGWAAAPVAASGSQPSGGALVAQTDEPCEYNPYLGADDPDCVPPCEYNEYLPSNDPGCEPPTTVEITVTEVTVETTTPTTEVEQVPPSVTETTEPQPPAPVAPAAAPATTVAAQPQVAPQAAAAPARLPETGGNTSLALFGGLFVLVGAMLVLGARRPATGRN